MLVIDQSWRIYRSSSDFLSCELRKYLYITLFEHRELKRYCLSITGFETLSWPFLICTLYVATREDFVSARPIFVFFLIMLFGANPQLFYKYISDIDELLRDKYLAIFD